MDKPNHRRLDMFRSVAGLDHLNIYTVFACACSCVCVGAFVCMCMNTHTCTGIALEKEIHVPLRHTQGKIMRLFEMLC